MKFFLLLLALSLSGAPAVAGSMPQRLDRVKSVSDGVCAIGQVKFLDKDDAQGKDPLWMFRSIAEDDAAVPANGFVRVDFVLRPETGSLIRCRAELPLPDKWNGLFWGRGNSGYAGSIPRLRGFAACGDAVVTTDLGTSRIAKGGRATPEHWPEAARKDFDWRATHLMTVYGKRIVKAFYGQEPRKNYFHGGSTGGRQAMSEAIRFPSDYDGIIANLPDNNAMAVEVGSWHLYRQTHDELGRLLFTTNEMRVVADAAIGFRRHVDPAPYAGKALADARFSAAEIDGFLEYAAKNCPSLRAGDKFKRLKAIYSPLCIGGECVFNGHAPGAYLVPRMNRMGIVYLRAYLNRLGLGEPEWGKVGEKEILGFIKEYAPTFNACSSDLSAFRRRGGKLIMTAGWEDQTIPPELIVDYYERVTETDGGLERTKDYFRLFCVPGCAHGGGKGRIITGAPGGRALRQILIGWVENGKAPETIPCRWADRKTSIPVAVYPGLSVMADGEWTVRETRRGASARLGDGVADTKVWPLEGDTVTVSNASASIVVETFGARIVSWKRNGRELLWMPRVREGGIWDHGGIPACWPWHGRRTEENLPIHGFSWAKKFRVLALMESPSVSVLKLGCGCGSLDLVYRIELGDGLKVEMVTKNNGSTPTKVAAAIHPYFAIGDIEAVMVNGRRFDGEFDKGFGCAHGDVYVVVDEVLKRKIYVGADEASRFVVWTPWTRLENKTHGRVAPLDAGAYRSFIAVEPVSDAWKNAKFLEAGKTCAYRASIRISEQPDR